MEGKVVEGPVREGQQGGDRPRGEVARAGSATDWRSRWRLRMRRNPVVAVVWRAAILFVGGLVSIAGLIMFITPGPGWLSLIAGLLILSLEFDWAERWLERTKQAALRARARAVDPAVRRRNLVAAFLGFAAMSAGAWWWVASFGVPPMAASVYESVVAWF